MTAAADQPERVRGTVPITIPLPDLIDDYRRELEQARHELKVASRTILQLRKFLVDEGYEIPEQPNG